MTLTVGLFPAPSLEFTLTPSIVDICITTPWRDLESVCLIADLLQRRMFSLCSLFGQKLMETRWYGKGRLRLVRQGTHREDLGP